MQDAVMKLNKCVVKLKDGRGFKRGGWKQKRGTPFFTALADIHGPWHTT